MIKIFNTRLFLVIGILFSIGLISSCNKNDDVEDNGKVELLSFGPTGANHGDTIRFFGRRLDQVTAIEFTSASVAKAEFKKQTNQEIMVVVPVTAERGYVTLKTPEGDIVSKTMFNLGVTATIASITPTVRPGENITITGDYLNWVERITFPDGKVVSSFVSKAKDRIVVTVPMDAQSGPLMVFYGGTDSAEVETEQTVTVTLPQATGVSPNPVKHQTNLTITGTDLDLVKQVILPGDTKAISNFVSQTPTQIVVLVDSGTTMGKVKLVALSGVETQSTQDLNVSLPAVTNLSANPIDPGADLTITGTNLDLVTSVAFSGVTNPVKTFISKTPTRIVVKVPTGVVKGKLLLTVLNSKLTVQTDQVLDIKGGLPALADFPYAIYTDALQNGFENWSFTDVKDFNSTAIVRQGDKSIVAGYAGNGYQGITFNRGTAISTAPYSTLEFSVFGTPGTGGKKLQVVINEQWGAAYQVTIAENEWSTFSVPLSALSGPLGTPPMLKQIVIQSAGFTGTVHIDHVGLR